MARVLDVAHDAVPARTGDAVPRSCEEPEPASTNRISSAPGSPCSTVSPGVSSSRRRPTFKAPAAWPGPAPQRPRPSVRSLELFSVAGFVCHVARADRSRPPCWRGWCPAATEHGRRRCATARCASCHYHRQDQRCRIYSTLVTAGLRSGTRWCDATFDALPGGGVNDNELRVCLALSRHVDPWTETWTGTLARLGVLRVAVCGFDVGGDADAEPLTTRATTTTKSPARTRRRKVDTFISPPLKIALPSMAASACGSGRCRSLLG